MVIARPTPFPRYAAGLLFMVLLGIAWSVVAIRLAEPASAMQPDSQGFLDFSPLRTALYPLVLRGIASVTGSPFAVVYVQIAAAALSAVALGVSVWRWSGRWYQGAVVLAALLANPYALSLHGQVLSDSFFIGTLCLIIAVLLHLDARPKTRTLAVLSLLTGLAIGLRPAAWALLGLWPFILWLYPIRARGARLALALLLVAAPGALVVTAERVAHAIEHGPEAPSLLDLHLFARAVSMDGAWPGDQAHPELYRSIEAFRAETERNAGEIPRGFQRNYYLQKREVDAQYRFPSGPLYASAIAERQLPVYRFQRHFGLKTIASNPLAYLRVTAMHYAMSWVLFTDDDPLPPLKAAVRFAIVTVGALTLLLAIAGLFLGAGRRLPAWLRVPWLCSLLLHGSFLLIGLTGVYVSRYTAAHWPAMAIALLLPALHWLDIALVRQGSVRRPVVQDPTS